MKLKREMTAPANSHFQASPRLINNTVPKTRLTTGNGSVLGWSRKISSAIKKNKVSKIIKALVMRAIHRMTLIDRLSSDVVFFIMFSSCGEKLFIYV